MPVKITVRIIPLTLRQSKTLRTDLSAEGYFLFKIADYFVTVCGK